MNYIKVEWIHNDDDPVLLYSELDDERWEVRKVEVYRDGHADYASATSSTGNTGLGLEPVPTLAEIGDDPEFVPHEIDAIEFEEIWLQATKKEKGQA